jgi:hypothetical protein
VVLTIAALLELRAGALKATMSEQGSEPMEGV